jgi:4-hydroxybenzoate polyprenyltransferase
MIIDGMKVNSRLKLKEYLRLGRLFNAEILGIILIISYILTTKIHESNVDVTIIIGLFIVGIFAHVWGAYNNDRFDLLIDKNAFYCIHKPLVSGTISINTAKKIEYIILFVFILLTIIISPKISTSIYLIIAIILAYTYNRFNKSSMITNIIGQMYASFVVLVGMSVVVDFDYIVFLSAIVIGFNGVYLNVVEADLKDIEGDVVNVPKALGVRINNGSASNTIKLYLLNDIIKGIIFLLIIQILILEEIGTYIILIAFGIFFCNYYIRYIMFKSLSENREKMKKYFATQEFTSILLISTIYIIINPLIPIIIILFVILWLCIWNKYLWGTFLNPQV